MIPAMSLPRQPLQNVVWLVGERVVRAALTATVLGIVARYLEPAGFGRLNFAVAVATIGAALASFGLEGVVVNELIRQPDRTGAILGTALRLRLLAGASIALLLNAMIWLTPALRADALLISIISLSLLLQPVEVVDLWFQRHLDSRRTAVARFIGITAGATLKLWLVARGATLTAFAWAQVADVGFIACSLTCVGWRYPNQSDAWHWDATIARMLWQRGAPLALASLAIAFSLRLDQLLVRQWLGQFDAGIYFAAIRLTDQGLFAGTAIAVSLFPALSASHARSDPEYRARLQAMFDALSAVGWVVVLGCILVGPWIIRVLYGPAYASAATVLVVQGWACLFALSASVRWNFIILSAPTIVNLGAALLHILTLLGFASILMPRSGALGAALALLLANMVSGVATTFLFPSLRPCGQAQLQGLLIPFTPGRWRNLLGQFKT